MMSDLMEFEAVDHPEAEATEFAAEEKTAETDEPAASEPEIADASEPEEQPEVSSTTNINLIMEEPTHPEEDTPIPPVIEEPSPSEPEQPSKEREVEEEKPAQVEATTTSRELTSFPARWMKEQGLDHRVVELIYWQDIKKTAIVFSTLVVVLLSLKCYSLLSVITFFSMAVLTVALLYRVGMTVMGAIQKSGADHPFRSLLDKEIEVPKEKAVEFAEFIADHINCGTRDLRKLFLVEDIVDSIKFGVVLWVLSYVGAWFSLLTLIIVAVVLTFSLPKVYEEFQDPIDGHLNVVRTQVNAIVEQAKSKLPEKLRPKEKTT